MTTKRDLDRLVPMPDIYMMDENSENVMWVCSQEDTEKLRADAFNAGLEEAAKLVRVRDPAHVGNVYAIQALKIK